MGDPTDTRLLMCFLSCVEHILRRGERLAASAPRTLPRRPRPPHRRQDYPRRGQVTPVVTTASSAAAFQTKRPLLVYSSRTAERSHGHGGEHELVKGTAPGATVAVDAIGGGFTLETAPLWRRRKCLHRIRR